MKKPLKAVRYKRRIVMKKAKYGSGFKLFDYYKTVARVGGVFSALSLSAMIYVIYYMFYNYMYGELKEELTTNSALKYSLIAVGIVLAIMVVVFVALKIASKRTSALDVALIVVGIADIVIMVKKFSIDANIRNAQEVLVYAIPLACTVVVSIVRWIVFSPRNNKLISTHGEKSNSNFKDYYISLFKKPSTWFMIVMALVIALMFVLAQAEGWLNVFDLNEYSKTEMIRNCAVMGGIAGVLFIIGLVIRLYNKTMNFMDAYSFALVPAGIVMIISYIIVQHTATLILALGAIVISSALQILYAKTSYLTDSIVCDEEEKFVEEPESESKAEEPCCVAEESKGEVFGAVAAVTEEHEDYGATLEAVQKTLDRIYRQNEELEERLAKAEEAIRSLEDKNAQLEKEVSGLRSSNRFVLLDIEKLMSRLSYLETKTGKLQPVVVVKTDAGENAFVMRAIENILSRLTYAESLVRGTDEAVEYSTEPCEAADDYPFIMLTLEKLLSRLTYAESLLAKGVTVIGQEEEIGEQPEEEVAEKSEEFEEQPEEVLEDEETEEDEDDESQEEESAEPAEEGEITWEEVASNKRRAKPRFTFDMKLRIASDDVKRFYSDIKNALLSYGMHARMSRHKENFNKGRNNIARMAINGKTLKVYLAIDPNEIDPKYYHHRDVSDKKGVAELPTMINVRSKVAVKKVKMLIDRIAEELVIFPKKYTPKDFAEDLTLDGYSTVERKGYGYLVNKDGVAKKEDVDAIPDDFATNAVEYIYAPQKASRFIKAELSLKELESNFKDGDVVDIEKVRDKGLCAVNANYLSVTDSNTLKKKFRVYADEYTVAAAKMICVAGGEAYMIIQPEA